MTPDPLPSEPRRERKRVVYIGRWRVAVFRNGPYHWGWRFWSREHFDLATRWFVVSALRRRFRA